LTSSRIKKGRPSSSVGFRVDGDCPHEFWHWEVWPGITLRGAAKKKDFGGGELGAVRVPIIMRGGKEDLGADIR